MGHDRMRLLHLTLPTMKPHPKRDGAEIWVWPLSDLNVYNSLPVESLAYLR